MSNRNSVIRRETIDYPPMPVDTQDRPSSFGRNGKAFNIALDVVHLATEHGHVVLQPITSKGLMQNCRISLPRDPVVLRAIAAQLLRAAWDIDYPNGEGETS
ncbi:MAG: hypothetical protein HQ492_00040 [Woeseiaceae bacterium]|nr:hypothetical protein [Woeseiaceae bacterium]